VDVLTYYQPCVKEHVEPPHSAWAYVEVHKIQVLGCYANRIIRILVLGGYTEL